MSNYFYNGVELPALPDVTKYNTAESSYDYAFIFKNLVRGGISIAFFRKPVSKYYRQSPFNNYCMRTFPLEEIDYYCEYTLNESNEWEEDTFVLNANPKYLGEKSPYIVLTGVDDKENYEIIWSNHDIVDNDNGGVYFAGNDPVPVEPDPEPPEPDEPEPVLAWKKHDAYKPNSNSIAYLYNGVELPDINTVWTDKATYPCAIITRAITDGTYFLDVCGDKPYYTEQSHSTDGYVPTVIAPKPFKSFAYVGGSWVLSIEDTGYGAALRTGTFELIWTNVDVMNKDNGSVYFNGSGPVIKGWDGNTFYRVMGGKWVKQGGVVPTE